jgi:hypothetical protein
MKKFLTSAILLAMFAAAATVKAQPKQDEYLGLPGDNLNLFAVMKLFQESSTLESFERDLNDENFRINNLDLNGDNMIDYITVRDYVDRDVHTIVLQDAINNRETQDVAVFTVQRFQNGQVQIQLIGDEALYGKNYIVEPITDDQLASLTPNPGYTGYTTWSGPVVRTTYYEIAAWPLVRFIFAPGYVVWHSSWHWGYYPSLWHSWHPYYWHYYYGYHYNLYHDYYNHYRYWNHPRWTHWNTFYYSSRHAYSPYVSHNIKSGYYKTTYSHPEQRRKGEDLYAKTYDSRGNRRVTPVTAGNTTGRTDSHSGRTANTTGNSFSTYRRTPATAAKPAMNQKEPETASTRRSTTVNAERNTGNHAKKEYNTFSERRSATAARPANNNKPPKNTSAARSVQKHEASATAPSSGKRGQESKASKANTSERKKLDEGAKAARR